MKRKRKEIDSDLGAAERKNELRRDSRVDDGLTQVIVVPVAARVTLIIHISVGTSRAKAT
jgi:hypothetical protein